MKRSADSDREPLGKFGPAFDSDLSVPGHVQAGQVLVHLQEVDQKGMVSGGANWGQNACRYRVTGHSCFVPHLENHAQYTCLRIAEAFTTEIKLSDRWVVCLQLGHWDATELLQRLALLLNNT